MSLDTTVRPAGSADIAAVDALLARTYPKLLKADYPPSVLVTALPLISRAQPKLITCGTYFVVERDGRLLGAGGYTRAAPGGGGVTTGVAHVRHVVTDDRHLRQGVGRRLMTHIFEETRALGLTRLACTATRTAVPFYAALGFTPLQTVNVPLAPGIVFPAVSMMRAL